MPIIDLQRGIAETGRIRIGQKVPTSNGQRPAKLDTFRLTSADRRRIDQVAEAYGGKVSEWEAPAGRQWQVITAATSLDVVVPPSEMAFSQWYELWSAGGCQRRCDGVTETIGERPCVCDPELRGRAKDQCDIHTRLSVMLRDLPGLGVWRLDTQGYYAAVELRGAVEVLQLAAGRGALLPARLRLEQRVVKRPGANGKPETRRYAVPVLDIEVSPAQLLSAGAQPLELAQVALPPLTPVPALPLHAAPSIADQSQPPVARAPRANAAAAIPASGRNRANRANGGHVSGEPSADVSAAESVPGDGAEVGSPLPSSGGSPAADGAGVAVDDFPFDVAPPACKHPAKRQTAADAGLVCGECGELLAVWGPQQAEARDPRQRLMARLHAEHDHATAKAIAAAVLGIDPREAWSMADLSEADLSSVAAVIDGGPAEPLAEPFATGLAEAVRAAGKDPTVVLAAMGVKTWTELAPTKAGRMLARAQALVS